MITDTVHLVADPGDRFEVREHNGTTSLYIISARGQASLTFTASQRVRIASLLSRGDAVSEPVPLRAVAGGE